MNCILLCYVICNTVQPNRPVVVRDAVDVVEVVYCEWHSVQSL